MKHLTPTKEAIKAYIKHLLATNKETALKCLEVVYNNQTIDEKMQGEAIKENGKGFGSFDAEFMTSIHHQFINKGGITDKQLEALHKNIVKYWAQFLRAEFIKTDVIERNTMLYRLRQFAKENDFGEDQTKTFEGMIKGGRHIEVDNALKRIKKNKEVADSLQQKINDTSPYDKVFHFRFWNRKTEECLFDGMVNYHELTTFLSDYFTNWETVFKKFVNEMPSFDAVIERHHYFHTELKIFGRESNFIHPDDVGLSERKGQIERYLVRKSSRLPDFGIYWQVELNQPESESQLQTQTQQYETSNTY